jgi:hypothetical protein
MLTKKLAFVLSIAYNSYLRLLVSITSRLLNNAKEFSSVFSTRYADGK